jgi:hypothetical protein
MLTAPGVTLEEIGDGNRAALVCTPAEISAFIRGVKDGKFDHLVR